MAKSAKATAPSKAHNGNGKHAAAKPQTGLNVPDPSTLEEGLRNRTEQISRALFSTEGADMSASATLKAPPKGATRKRETAESMALLRRIASERELTLLFTEHDMDVVFATAHRVAVLHQGRLIAEGTPAAIRRDAEVKRVYLGDLR